MLVARCKAHREDIGQRGADRSRHAVLAIVAGKGADVAAHFGERRSLGDIVDGARKGVATVQRADRALHDFDPLDVDQADGDCGAVLDIDAVEEHRHVRIAAAAVEVGLAANDRIDAEFGTAAGDDKAGGQIGDVAQVADVRLLKRVGAERGDRQRHVLKLLLTVPRSHDDFAAVLRHRCGLVCCRCRLRCETHQRCAAQHENPQHSDCPTHAMPPC